MSARMQMMQNAQEAAEQAQSDAEAAAQSVSQSAAQISQNTVDISDLKSALNDISNGVNLFNSLDAIDDSRLDEYGAIVNSQGSYISPLIPVESGKVYYKNSPITNNFHRACVYDSVYHLIPGQVFNENRIPVHSNGAYVRFCGLVSEKPTASFVMSSAKDLFARNDIDELKILVDEISDNQVNLFDSNIITTDKRLDGHGYVIDGPGYYVSSFIPVIPNFTYKKNSPIIDNYHRFCIYDKTAAFIPGTATSDNSITIPNTGAYVRFCGATSEAETAILSLVSANDVLARNNTNHKLSKTISGDNIFDKNSPDNCAGRFLNYTGGYGTNENYSVSYYIEVEAGKQYSLSDSAGYGASYNFWYDKYRQPIGDGFQNTTIPWTNTAPDGACYLRISYHTSANIMLTQSSSVHFYKAYEDIDCEKVIRDSKNALNGLNADQTKSVIGESGETVTASNLVENTVMTLINFPLYLKKEFGISFYGKFSSFDTLKVGKGFESYRGDWVEITSENIIFHHYETSSPAVVEKTVAHGLEISDYIMVNLYMESDGKFNVSINSKSGSFRTSRTTDFNVLSGSVFASTTLAMTNVKLAAQSGDLRKPLWVIGDSYFGVVGDRVLGQLKALGYWEGYAADGLAGLGPAQALTELNKMLLFGTPKYLVWYLGMNGYDEDYETTLASLIDLCTSKNITLILNKVPTVPSRSKEYINSLVVGSGKRYIDSYAAVGADSVGNWYTYTPAGGSTQYYLNQIDKVHPTELGAKALAQQFILDVPEIMMYGYNYSEVGGTTTGDN